MRLFFLPLIFAFGVAWADELTTNQAIIQVSDLYPGSVLSANRHETNNDIVVRLLSPAGLVHTLVVCKNGAKIEVKELVSESSGSRGSTCDSVAAES